MAVPTFSFSTTRYPTQFTVLSFTGTEKMSHLFEYIITVKNSTEINPESLIGEEAVFTFTHNGAGADMDVSGILSSIQSFDQNAGGTYHYYQVTLVPQVWENTLSLDYEIFVNKTPKEIITEEINDAGLSHLMSTTEISSSSSNSPNMQKPFTCQYNESDFSFISRLAEHHGIYYYFDHDNGSKLMFADDKNYPTSHQFLEIATFPAGEQYFNQINNISTWSAVAPGKVIVSGYSPSQPSLKISGEAINNRNPGGPVVRLTTEDVYSVEEAAYIAQVRLDEIVTSKRGQTTGKSGIIGLRPGFMFNGRNYTDCLVVEIEHIGNNLDTASTNGSGYYENIFKARRTYRDQFRPGSITPKPVATSTIGTVYSEALNPRLAEMNAAGEYRVKFNFLIGDVDPVTGNEKVSSWLRMATPTAGTEDGLTIPLKGGVEVLIGFEGGNPDKPYIQSAMPNAAFPAHVTAENAHNALIATSGLLGLKANGGWYRNVHVDEADWDNLVFGADPHTFNKMTNHPKSNTVSVGEVMTEEDEMSGDYIVNRLYGDQYTWADGINYEWDNKPTYSFGNGYDEFHENDQMSIINTEVFPLPWMPDGKEDREDGHIEKVWGDKFEYHKGRVYAWKGGTGPGGSLQTFNYGNGYTENLLESSKGTSADLSEDKKAHMDDYNGLIDTSVATIEKTFGATYSYQNGYSMDVKVGESHSHTHGNSHSITKGDSVSSTEGNSTDTIHGEQRATIHGDMFEDIWGNTESWHHGDNSKEVYTGTRNGWAFAASNSTTLGASSDIHIGTTNSICLVNDNNLSMGLTINIQLIGELAFQLAGFLKVTNGIGIDLKTGAYISENSTKMEGGVTDIKSFLCHIYS
jgi:type VI secretion system secreted protein VgrG